MVTGVASKQYKGSLRPGTREGEEGGKWGVAPQVPPHPYAPSPSLTLSLKTLRGGKGAGAPHKGAGFPLTLTRPWWEKAVFKVSNWSWTVGSISPALSSICKAS